MFPEGGGGGGGDLDGALFPKLPPGEPAKPLTGHRHEAEHQPELSTMTLNDLMS